MKHRKRSSALYFSLSAKHVKTANKRIQKISLIISFAQKSYNIYYCYTDMFPPHSFTQKMLQLSNYI